MYQAAISKIDRKTHEVTVLSVPEGMAFHLDAGLHGLAEYSERRRQGLDQQPGGQPQLPARSRHRQVRESRARPRRPAASRSAPTACPPITRTTLSAGIRRPEHRPARCQDARGHDLADRDAAVAPAARAGRRAEPPVVRRIWRQRHRPVRSQDRHHQGVASCPRRGARPTTWSRSRTAPRSGPARC